MQNDLDKLFEWFNYNKLSPNTSKSETTSIGSTHQNSLTIHTEPVSQKLCSKYLGLLKDSKLTFRGHINHIVNYLLNFAVSSIELEIFTQWNVNCRLTTHMQGLWFAMAY